MFLDLEYVTGINFVFKWFAKNHLWLEAVARIYSYSIKEIDKNLIHPIFFKNLVHSTCNDLNIYKFFLEKKQKIQINKISNKLNLRLASIISEHW